MNTWRMNTWRMNTWRTSTWMSVARVHLMDRQAWLVQPWLILALTFVINLVLAAEIPLSPARDHYTGAVASIYVVLIICGAITVARQLPFQLALGVSRRSFYAGTVAVAMAVALVYGLSLALLQIIERASGGWWLRLDYFRVPYLLPGPWYLTWLTSFVGLALAIAWGMWFGIVYRRWNMAGLLTFIAAQTVAVAAIILVIGVSNGWSSVGHFFSSLTIEGLTGILAAVTIILLASGFTTARRAAV
jgi:hypothetical protein